MREPSETREALRSQARLSGLELSDQRIEELMPLLCEAANARVALDQLDLGEAGLAVIFRPLEE